MISLKFQKTHRSITALSDLSLPDFAVITGVNGSGKSHLLEAIENGAISVEGVAATTLKQPGRTGQPEKDSEIRLFNWTNFVPNQDPAADPLALGRTRQEILSRTRGEFAAKYQIFLSTMSRLGLSAPLSRYLGLTQEEFAKLAPGSVVQSATIWNDVDLALTNLVTAFDGNKTEIVKLIELVDKRGGQPGKIAPTDLENLIPWATPPKDVFQQNLSEVFATYHSLFEHNHYVRFCNQEYKRNERVRTDEEFKRDHGEPPWELLNRVLTEAHLDYSISSPAGRPAQLPFQARLICKTPPQATVSFNDLSSGEKILMSLAICLYNGAGRKGRYPKLLLLDEVDAPLHPTMTKDLIRVIQRVLVRENGVRVMMSTHSPATVAFSPDHALFQLKRSPRVLEPCEREEAVQALSSGFITVTDNSRFVITEAKHDRLIYTAISKKLVERGILNAVPNLVFIQASDKKDRTGGGREQVRNWAAKLPSAGLTQVFGLIDRDRDNISCGRIKVIGRYSIENYLMDPILLYAVLMHYGEHWKVTDIGLADRNYFALRDAQPVMLQQIVDSVTTLIASRSPHVITSTARIQVEYVAGKTVLMPAWLRDCDGHSLESAVRGTFQSVVGPDFIITRNECEDLVDMLSERLPEFIPIELLDVFRALQG